jgi:twitching motility protein PilT
VTAGHTVYYRIDGDLKAQDAASPNRDETLAFLKQSLSDYQWREFDARWAADGAYGDNHTGRIRIHAREARPGVALRIRFLDDRPPDLAQLDLPPIIGDWIRRPSGLIVLSGVTGSGKTTLQAALLWHALATGNPSILTLEDPIEYLFDTDDRVLQHERGRHFTRFEQALSEFMRCDPDIIMLGEVRSPETAKAVLTAVESGHLCICTGHARDTARVFDRILAMFPEGERDLARSQLAQHLIGVIGLKLVKRRVREDGLPGRRAACEILERSDTVASALLNNSNAHEIRDAVTNGGGNMKSMEMHLSELVQRGDIDVDAAREAAEYPDELRLR